MPNDAFHIHSESQSGSDAILASSPPSRSTSLVKLPRPGPRGPIALKLADIRPAIGKLPVPPVAPPPHANLFPGPLHAESQSTAILHRGESILAPHPALVARCEHYVMRQHVGPLS